MTDLFAILQRVRAGETIYAFDIPLSDREGLILAHCLPGGQCDPIVTVGIALEALRRSFCRIADDER